MSTAVNFNPYEGFANAIILQAVKDYRDACKKLAKGRINHSAEATRNECRRFFLSDWFTALTDVDGAMLLRKLDEEVGA